MIEKHTKNTLQHEESGFTTLINEVINSIKHTGGLGVYCYLASKPAGWNICKKNLQNQFKCGRDHIETCFKYLRKIGAIEVTMIRDEKGRVLEWQTILKRKFNKPILENIQNTENPLPGESSTIRVFHDLDISQSGDPAPINKRYKENKEYINTFPDSDESGKMVYTESDEVNTKTNKSDYSDNHQENEKITDNPLESTGKTEKSDYCYTQLEKESDRSDSDHIVVNSIRSPKKKSLFASNYQNDERFMRFYNAYPKKIEPNDAYKAFKGVIGHNDELLELILNDIEQRLKRDSKWQDKQYIKYPAGYLRKGEYLSEIYNANEEAKEKERLKREENEKRLKELELQSQRLADDRRLNEQAKHRDARTYRETIAKIPEISPVAKDSLKNLRKRVGIG
jgi:hypothetical protein